MTRAERIAALLATALNHRMPIPMSDTWYAELTIRILVLADDDRPLMSLKGFADHIGRNRTTILSWVARGSHDVPRPIADTDAGGIWDSEQVMAWAALHPELCQRPQDEAFTRG